MSGIANEVEIVVTAKNRAKSALADVRRDVTDVSGTFRSLAGTIRDSMAKARTSIKASLRDALGDADRDGRGLGRRIGGGLAHGLKETGGALKFAVTGMLQATFSTPVIGGVILAALGGVAAVLGPALGTLIGGSLVLGIGTALAGAGAAALFHVEEVNKEWSKAEQRRVEESNKQAEKLRRQWGLLGRDIVNGLKQAAQPLIPVLDTIRGVVRDVGRTFGPVLSEGFKEIQKPLQRFVKNLGEGFKELAPALEPLFASFGVLLDEIGPQLPGIFASLADSLTGLASTITENRDLFALLFGMLMSSLPAVINLVSLLASGFRGALSAFLGFTDVVLAGVQSVLEAIAAIPGPWQESARQMVASIQTARDQLGALKGDVDAFPRRVELEGQITDLQAKIAQAKAELKNPRLTRPEKAAIRAEISQLQSQVRTAKAELASIQNRNVSVTVTHRDIYLSAQREQSFGFGLSRNRVGGIIGGIGAGVKRFASGGISGAGASTALVGEDGPELVRLPVGSSVTPAGQTRSMLGGNSISMAFRQVSQSLSGGGGSSAVDKMIEKLTAMIKEVVSLRDAFTKLSGGIFGSHRALIAYESAWDAARKSLKENGKVLSIGREKGRENRSALLSLAEAAQEVAVAMREQGRSTTSITAKMKEQRAEFIRIARAMGMTKKEAKDLADRYGLIPSKVKTAIETEIKTTKSNKAINKKISALERASGGPAGGMTLLGERGPELVKLPFGASVTPAGQTAAMMAGSARGGMGEIHITLHLGRERLGELVLDPLRKSIRTRGGNVQAVLGR